MENNLKSFIFTITNGDTQIFQLNFDLSASVMQPNPIFCRQSDIKTCDFKQLQPTSTCFKKISSVG